MVKVKEGAKDIRGTAKTTKNRTWPVFYGPWHYTSLAISFIYFFVKTLAKQDKFGAAFKKQSDKREISEVHVLFNWSRN